MHAGVQGAEHGGLHDVRLQNVPSAAAARSSEAGKLRAALPAHAALSYPSELRERYAYRMPTAS